MGVKYHLCCGTVSKFYYNNTNNNMGVKLMIEFFCILIVNLAEENKSLEISFVIHFFVCIQLQQIFIWFSL